MIKSKVAIVGMGYWAPVLLRGLLELNVTVDAIAETNLSRINYIKKNHKKIKIFKNYKLEEVVQAHKDLEERKILGPAVIVPN